MQLVVVGRGIAIVQLVVVAVEHAVCQLWEMAITKLDGVDQL